MLLKALMKCTCTRRPGESFHGILIADSAEAVTWPETASLEDTTETKSAYRKHPASCILHPVHVDAAEACVRARTEN